MSDQNQPQESLQDLKDIRRMMERSSRFISLSGLAGISAGICALAGAWIALGILKPYYEAYNRSGYFSVSAFSDLRNKLMGVAAAVFVCALLSAFLFTWQRAKKQGLPLWDYTSRRLMINILIPLAAGAAFILGMLQRDHWDFVAPASLIFYGLSLVNASKYTLTDIRYLGYCEIVLGLINMQWIGYGLYFWAMGFGVLHIIYGIIMWFKYERNP